jgi:transposase-like protein
MEQNEGTRLAICPYCSHVFNDSWTFIDLGSYTCPGCKNRFSVTVEYVKIYTTRKASAPKEVLIAASFYLNGASMEIIAKALYGDGKKFRQRAWRNVNKWKEEYPKIFNKNDDLHSVTKNGEVYDNNNP